MSEFFNTTSNILLNMKHLAATSESMEKEIKEEIRQLYIRLEGGAYNDSFIRGKIIGLNFVLQKMNKEYEINISIVGSKD
jgi:hypothetical protein